MPDRDQVVADNAQQLAMMDSEAAGLIQHFFLECDRRDTLVAFSNAEEGGKAVDVEVVAGEQSVMELIARLLRFTLNGSRLEV